MRLSKRQLKRIIREERSKLLSEQEERVVFDPESVDFTVPKKLIKLLDPDITPQKFAQRDAELDDTGKPNEHAFALVAYALTYADNDPDQALKILKLAITQVPKIIKGMKSGEKEE